MSDSKSTDQWHRDTHMKLLSRSGSANKYGELTVIPLGHAVTIAEEIVATRVEREKIDAEEALLRDLNDTGEIHHSVFDYRLEDIEARRALITKRDEVKDE